MSERVIVSDPVVGICYMQVCCVRDATDEEILAACNAKNPSGTSAGWTQVLRDGPHAPVACAQLPGRVHLLAAC